MEVIKNTRWDSMLMQELPEVTFISQGEQVGIQASMVVAFCNDIDIDSVTDFEGFGVPVYWGNGYAVYEVRMWHDGKVYHADITPDDVKEFLDNGRVTIFLPLHIMPRCIDGI